MTAKEQQYQLIAEKVYDVFLAEANGLPETDWQLLVVLVMKRFVTGAEISLWTTLQMNAIGVERILASRANLDKTCPRCGHVHEGDSECGQFMGGGGYCRCELPVPDLG
jgi:hypothetical protein